MVSQQEAEPSEDYVAELLKKDARNYAAQTVLLGSVVAPRPASHNRKPNLRFLNNIIRETDTHNSALKLRELEQAGDRLRKLHGDPPRTDDRRSRRRGRDHSSLSRPRDRSQSRETRRPDRWRSRYRSRSRSPQRHDRREERRCRDDVYDRRPSRHLDRSPRRRRHARDERSGSEDLDAGWGYRDSPRRRQVSGTADETPNESRSPRRRHVGHRHDHVRADRNERRHRHRHDHSEHDLFPGTPRDEGRLDREQPQRHTSRSPKPRRSPPDHGKRLDSEEKTLIKLPTSQPEAVVRRGRGSHTTSQSAMDSRFLSTYDSKLDVTTADGDDWGRALEAARRRAQWQDNQSERLRAAGFTFEEVERWASVKKEEDVVWKTKGEDREWDRGKVFQDGEDVVTKPDWAR